MTGDDELRRAGEAPRDSARAPRVGAARAGASGAEMAGAGFQFAASTLICLFGGRWLDRRLGTGPWMLVLGALLGAAVGFYAMYRTMMASQARARRTTTSSPPTAPRSGASGE